MTTPSFPDHDRQASFEPSHGQESLSAATRIPAAAVTAPEPTTVSSITTTRKEAITCPPVLAASLFTDPGHIIVVAIPIIGVVAYVVSRRKKDPSHKPDVFDPTSHDAEHPMSPSQHAPGHSPGHGSGGHHH
jgi:hypothetical protein